MEQVQAIKAQIDTEAGSPESRSLGTVTLGSDSSGVSHGISEATSAIVTPEPDENNISVQASSTSSTTQQKASVKPKPWYSRIFAAFFGRDQDPQWSVHWFLPLVMSLFYISGALFAVGHHFYYRSQKGANCTLKKKPLKISTIDAVFVGSQNPIGAFNLEFLTKASSQFLLAAVCWLLPLSAITSPSSLVAVPASSITRERCSDVPAVHFLNYNDYDEGGNLDQGKDHLSQVYYWHHEESIDVVTYDMPSFEIESIAAQANPSDGPLLSRNPCPAGTNCTYSIPFDGPAYRCEDQIDFDGSTGQTLELFPPRNVLIYSASLIQSTQNLNGLGIPVEWSNMTKTDPMYGVFTKSYPIWIGYVQNTTRPYKGPNDTMWPYELERKTIKCTLNYAEYDVKLSFRGGRQFVDETNIDHKRPLLLDGEQTSPQNKSYDQFSAYHTLGFLFHKFISHEIMQVNASTYPWPSSGIAQTALIDKQTYMPLDNFPRLLENKFTDLLLSLLTSQQFSLNLTDVPCTVERPIQVWQYHPFWLLMTYGIAAGVALLAVATGVYAFVEIGYGMDTVFSTVLAVTRSKELDDLMAGYSLGGAPLPKRIMKTRLKFGEIKDGSQGQKTEEGERNAGFGTEDNVREIKFGERYR
ncbi:hypothetical protein QBC44DRAFT_397734 [Cladorrhinum sp. PSN332]|nr:hypothetical protein QBC44DRAFT_397734 [Cladorrhinum sp. PSN332]